jgi:hypothetical protein
MVVISSGSVSMGLYKVKDWNPILRGYRDGILDVLDHEGYDPYIILIRFSGIVTTTLKSAAPHITDTEVFPANSKLGLGGGTPVNVFLVSDNPLDTGIVYLIGWGVDGNGDDNLIAEEMTLNGVTNVTSTRTWYEVFHMKASKAVTGTVTLEYPENTTLLTIAAGKTNSNGSGFTVPLEWQCYTLNTNVKINGAVLGRVGWFGIRSIEEDSDGNLDGNQELIWHHAKAYHNDVSLTGHPNHRYKDSNNNELRIEHHMCHEVSAATLDALRVYVLWAQTITETLTN